MWFEKKKQAKPLPIGRTESIEELLRDIRCILLNKGSMPIEQLADEVRKDGTE